MRLQFIKLKVFDVNLGLTLENIVVGDIRDCWAPEQLYVAISRIRSHDKISFLKPFQIQPNAFTGYTLEDLNRLFGL